MPVGEFLSSNTGISFPFKSGQDMPEYIRRLFVDACVHSSLYDVAVEDVSYTVDGCVLSFSAAGEFFKTTLASGKVFSVVRSGLSSFVIDNSYLDTLGSFEFSGPVYIEPTCVVVDADTVESIELYNGEDDPRNAVVTGDVTVSFGYNTELSSDDDDGTIKISAEPGYGLGTVPCDDTECDEDSYTNGEPIPTDNGNAVIAGDDCYEITASGNTIQIHGKCTACCQCQDYIDIVNDLKIVAERVKTSKKDLTEDKTEVYFDFIHKQTLASGYPDVHVQLDISPDADIASLSHNGKPPGGFNEWQAFRVTCVITNLTGVPCYIATPALDMDENEISRTWRGWIPKNYASFDGGYIKAQDCINAGVVAGVCLTDGYLVSGAKYVRNNALINDPSGWVAYTRSRGPVLQPNDLNENKIKYSYPETRVGAGYLDRVKETAESAVTTCTQWALEDLNNQENPSGMLDYADSLTDTLAKDKNVGFLAPAGYSFTITNAYMVPGGSIGDIKAIIATFVGYAFAPMLAYTAAYNFAKSETSSRKEKDGVTYYNTWVKGYDVPPGRLYRPIMAFAAYDASSGKQLYRGGEDEKWQ